MKTLIIENDIYLSQSIANKLIDRGYDCVVSKDTNFKTDKNNKFDIILISYDVCDKNRSCPNLVKHFAGSIVIMMIRYINDDTVTKMFQAGIQDYIVKPLIIDELIRKIEHYKQFRRLQSEVVFYKNYFEFIEGILNTPIPLTYNPPFVIRSNNQRSADIYAMRYARLKNIQFDFLSLKNLDWRDVPNLGNNTENVVYLTGLEQIRKSDRNEILAKLNKQHIICSFVSQEEISFGSIVDISTPQNDLDFNGTIMSVRDYEKLVISKYGNIYSDIDLSKELGISRKSLWEKRKRYGITKQRKPS